MNKINNMKKYILTTLLIAALTTAKSQVIDTTFKPMTACKITPFKAQFSDSLSVTHLGVKIINDDLKSSAVMFWAVMYTNGGAAVVGNMNIEGEDYKKWDGSNLFVFKYVADKLKLTFIK